MKALLLSKDGRVTLPADVRKMANMTGALRLVAVPVGNSIVLTPVVKPSDLLGIAEGANPHDYRDRRP